MKVGGLATSSLAREAPPSPDAALNVITREQVIEKLKRADRALLLRELAPNQTAMALEKTISLLIRMRAAGELRFNGQTDRWSLSPKVLHVER